LAYLPTLEVPLLDEMLALIDQHGVAVVDITLHFTLNMSLFDEAIISPHRLLHAQDEALIRS